MCSRNSLAFCLLLALFAPALAEASTLELLTRQRAELENLKLQVSIKEQEAKLDSLKAVPAMATPFFDPQLLNALQVAPPSALPQQEVQLQKKSGSELLSVQGLDTKLTARLRTSSGKLVTLSQGQSFEKGTVRISRDKVIIQRSTNTETLYLE